MLCAISCGDGGLVVAESGSNYLDKKNPASTGFADPKVIENGADQVTLFYLVGEDRVWHPAKVRIEGDKAVVTSDAVRNPRGVAYGTGGIGFQPNLYNQALLPTSPFIYYDHKLVTRDSWPDAPIKIADVETDPSSVGLTYEYRKFPIFDTQFRDNAVLQTDQPLTIWGATVPAMEASAKPKTLKASLIIDGELVHERVIENVIIGDIWYVYGLGDQKIDALDAAVSGPIRIMTRKAKGVKTSRVRPYSVATSTTPKHRFASYWSTPTADGFAANLAKAIHAKTDRPVGIIYMDEDDLELKHLMDAYALGDAASLKDEYKEIAAITPGPPATPFAIINGAFIFEEDNPEVIAAEMEIYAQSLPGTYGQKSTDDRQNSAPPGPCC